MQLEIWWSICSMGILERYIELRKLCVEMKCDIVVILGYRIESECTQGAETKRFFVICKELIMDFDAFSFLVIIESLMSKIGLEIYAIFWL